jgi:ElaB/YqjD/DUF883 family membrane-anchored ribosome-binding protein
MVDNIKGADDLRPNGAGDDDYHIRELARRAEEAVRARAEKLRDTADELRGRARDYYDDASEHLDTAQRYIVERVQERPVASTLAAVGVGVLIGLVLSGGRRR